MSDVVRLSVNMNPATAAALKKIAESHRMTYTETIRRAISVLDYFDKEQALGNVILVTDNNGKTRQLEWL